jgi:hypothetical protein
MPKDEQIIYSGGCALNVTWNRKLLDEGYNLSIEPPVYDGGISIGCLRFGHEYLNIPQPIINNFPYVQDDFCPSTNPSQQTIDKVSDLLAQGKIVGWYQGNGELGPRALGNRSILMDPTIKNGKEIINSKVKHREWWRPFGASVKEDKSLDYFDIEISEKHRIPMETFCNYKYLLNLPGFQPWSYRFKYLFLMNSIVINIDLYPHFKKNDPNQEWRTFIDRLFEDGKDYVNIIMNWFKHDDLENKKELNNVLSRLNDIYKYYNKIGRASCRERV